jgi:toxin ParE1/3/4
MTVRLTRAAEEDIAAIYAYYAERDPDLAGRVSRAIIGAIDGLVDFPLMGREGQVPNTRERIMTRYPYRIVYRIVGEQVFILRVLAPKAGLAVGRQDATSRCAGARARRPRPGAYRPGDSAIPSLP